MHVDRSITAEQTVSVLEDLVAVPRRPGEPARRQRASTALRSSTSPNPGHAPNDERVIPINIDHREATPPTAQELAEIKRFIFVSRP
jgi:hypothetical protein